MGARGNTEGCGAECRHISSGVYEDAVRNIRVIRNYFAAAEKVISFSALSTGRWLFT